MYNDDRIHPLVVFRQRAALPTKRLSRESNEFAACAAQTARPRDRGERFAGDRAIRRERGARRSARSSASETADTLAIGTLCDIPLEQSAGGERGAERASGGSICSARSSPKNPANGAFQAGIAAYPKIGSAVVAVGGEELQIIFGLAHPSTVEIGRLQQNAAIAATVNVEEMVRKHFAIVGSTGSGKSSGLALILRKIMQARSDLRMLLIDAHNEYADCFDGRAQVFGPANLKLPFWLFNFDELAQIVFGSRARAEHEIGLLAELIPLAKTEYARAKSALALELPGAAGGRRRPLYGRHAGALPFRRRHRRSREPHGQARERRPRGAVPAAAHAHQRRAQEPALRLHLRRWRRDERLDGRHSVPAAAAQGRRAADGDRSARRLPGRDDGSDRIGAVPAGVRIRRLERRLKSAAHRLRGSAQLRQCRSRQSASARRGRGCRASPRKAASTASFSAW